ncbi:TIGR00180 family glycosyltransferase [Clostridium botulinum]|nr:TIGR00180 family glycosyltransferase [Clostridium botulinum]MCS4524960.1 TIGR00180 family glycosyltransferase [Clostridium botulinum]
MDNIEKYKVAVLMPTKDRPRYLKRQLMYLTSMSDEEMDVYIYIADSSSKDIINNNKKFIKNLNNNKIQHFIYDKNTDFNHKILNTAQNINIEELFICADDDFIIKETLKKSLKILSNSQEYMAVKGTTVYFDELRFNKIKVITSGLANLEEDNKIERLKNIIIIIVNNYGICLLKLNYL